MIEIQNIQKKYSNGRGIEGITFSVPASSVTAVIGPNGAGKSTLFNSLNGLMFPDSGSVLLDHVPLQEIPLSRIGVLPEDSFLLENFTVLQMVDYMSVMKEIPVTEDEVEYLLNGFSLTEYRSDKIRSFSMGMKKRVSLICSILGNPAVSILDEPLNALDVQSVLFLKEVLQKLKGNGSHIILSSHILDFLDDLADQVVFLSHGKVEAICTVGGDTHVEDLYREIYRAE